MANLMKSQVFSTASRRSTVVVQARRTAAKPSKSSTPDSLVRLLVIRCLLA